MHGTYDRDVDLRHPAHQQGLALGDAQPFLHRGLGHLLDVAARTESGALATQQDRAHAGVTPCALQRLNQPLRSGEVERVAHLLAGKHKFEHVRLRFAAHAKP